MQQRLFFPLLIFLAFSLNAQTDARWGTSVGWAQTYTADQHTSPLLYRADALRVASIYQREARTFFEISLAFQLGTQQAYGLGKRSGTFRETPNLFAEPEAYDFVVNPFLSRLGGRLSVRALWPVSSSSSLGAGLQVRYDMAGMSGDNWQFALADLGPTYRYVHDLERGSVQLDFSLPLLSGVVRPNWAVDPSLSDETNYFKGYLRTGSALTSVHELFNPRLSLGYDRTLSNARTLGIAYRIDYLSYPHSRPLRMFEHGVQMHYLW